MTGENYSNTKRVYFVNTYINKPILIRQHHGYQLATWEKQNCQKYRTFVLSRIILREGESTRYKICQKPTHNLFILLQHYFLIWESGVRSLEFRWWISVVKVRGKIEKKIYYKSIRTFVARLYINILAVASSAFPSFLFFSLTTSVALRRIFDTITHKHTKILLRSSSSSSRLC